jgi:hypothetical protein
VVHGIAELDDEAFDRDGFLGGCVPEKTQMGRILHNIEAPGKILPISSQSSFEKPASR